jgi:hypothetical protein
LNKVLGAQGEVPAWVELKRDIEVDIKKYKKDVEEKEKGGGVKMALVERLKKVKEINEKILYFNVSKPNSIPQMFSLTVPKE